MYKLLIILLILSTSLVAGEWHARRLPDTDCLNTGPLRCHAAGYPASKLQGRFNRYELRFNMSSGATGAAEHTGRFSLGLHSQDPNNDALLVRMLNDTAQQCTDPLYCTLQTWWEKNSPKVRVSRDTARLMYPLTPIGDPFPFYDMVYNETVEMDQLYGAGGWWNETVALAFQGYSSVADLQDCDTPFDVHPVMRPVIGQPTEDMCSELVNDNITAGDVPFTATGMLPLDCARLPLPDYLYNDVSSDIGAHPLRTAFDLMLQQEQLGGLPGTVGFLRPSAQLTSPWQKYASLYGFMARAKVRHRARAYPPCSSGPNPDTLVLSHFYQLGPECQLFRVAPTAQWLWRANITVTFQPGEVHPAMATVVDPQTGEYAVQGSWWLRWDGQSVSVQPEGNFLPQPIGNVLRHFVDLAVSRLIQLDDSKHRATLGAPSLNGAVVVCGSQLDSAWGVAQNPWAQTPWLRKPAAQWYMPVPSPRFLRTGWTDDQWNSPRSAAELAAYRPGPFYWVPPEVLASQFGPACGQVGATGPCPDGSSSIDNDWGPIHAFERLDDFGQDASINAGMPESMLTDHPAQLPPLATAWGNDLNPRAWVAAHTTSNIPLSLFVEPASELLNEAVTEMQVHLSDRLANPRTFPRHRRSATNSTSGLPLRNIYQQVLNQEASQCTLNWYNLSLAFSQNRGDLSGFLQNVVPPPSGMAVGSLHSQWCNPDGFHLPPNQRSVRQYLETWTCRTSEDDSSPPLQFRSSLGDAHAVFNASGWQSPTGCADSQSRVFYPVNTNYNAAKAWWRSLAQKVQDTGWVRFEALRCTVQLTDPEASPQIGLFPTEQEPEHDPRLPARFLPVSLPSNTLRCFLQVGLPQLPSKEALKELAKAHESLSTKLLLFENCNPFVEDCELMNVALLEYLLLMIIEAAFVIAAIVSGIVAVVWKCQERATETRTKKMQ